MKKLFLTSSFIDVYKYFKSFVGNTKGKTITFIPTASVKEEYTGYVDNDRKAFEELGVIIDELDISNTSKNKIEETIQKNDFIYISGGNTFYLLQELKVSGSDEIIRNEIKKGKPYVGASAGSIILSKSILFVEKMDDKSKAEKLVNYDALNLVDFYTLPHHTNKPFKHIVEEIITDYNNKINLLPISNTEAILVSGVTMEIIGTK